MPWRRAPARRLVAALLCGGALLITACSSSGPSSSAAQSHMPSASAHAGSAAASSKVDCDAVDSLRSSVDSISHTEVSPSSAATLTADLKNIQAQLTKLEGPSGGSFAPDASELQATVSQIEKAAAELSTNPTAAAKQLTSSINDLKDDSGTMVSKMNSVCPTPAR